MTALMPHAASAHGACSRDEPVPKLSPTRRIARPAIPGRSRTKSGSRKQTVSSDPPPALALAALEVAVARRDGVLAGAELVAVHRDAHRAAGLAPLGPGGAEDLVEPLAAV